MTPVVPLGGRHPLEIHEAGGISDETVTVTFAEIEPGMTELVLVNAWTGPPAGAVGRRGDPRRAG